MTIEEKIREMLIERGLFENQAQAVIDMAKTDIQNKAMLERWSDDVDGYPQSMLNILWLFIEISTLKWIDENLPLAWFRSLFIA